jgi:hypothetical protein
MCRRAGALFHPLVVETRLRGMSKPTAKIITTQAMLAVHRTGSDLMVPQRKPRQKLSFNVQMLRRTRSQCACRLVTRITRDHYAECRHHSSMRCGGVAVADGTPPTVTRSERAGSDRHKT